MGKSSAQQLLFKKDLRRSTGMPFQESGLGTDQYLGMQEFSQVRPPHCPG